MGTFKVSKENFEQLILAHLKITNDKGASGFAAGLLDLLRDSNHPNTLGGHDFGHTAAGTAAMRVFPQVEAGSYPKTIGVLWDAVVQGWMVDSAYLPPEVEAGFIRFISETKLWSFGGETKNLMLEKLRHWTDFYRERSRDKILRFLQIADMTRSGHEIVQAMFRSLAKFVATEEMIFQGHMLDSIKYRKGGSPEALEMALPIITKQMATLVQRTKDITGLAKEIAEFRLMKGELRAEMRDDGSALFTIITDSFTGAVPDLADEKMKFMVESLEGHVRMKILKWRLKGPEYGGYDVCLNWTYGDTLLRQYVVEATAS